MPKKNKRRIRKTIIKPARQNFIDGWGVILLIIGIALFLLREEMRTMGGIIALAGFIRIIYVFIRYG